MKKLIINTREKKHTINRNIYGHFSEHLGRCIYGGLYVGEDSDIPNVNGMRSDAVAALRRINAPVLRWPGGCFADEYHWMDGVGPKASRKRMVNTHWGGVTEDNSFGTHEFMELCRQIGCEPYVNGNLGSGTVREMSEWVEYITCDGVSPMSELRKQNGREEPWKLKYFAVGNENWGCGGNMRPEFYADQYRRYQTYLRRYGDNALYKIACGANSFDYDWTDKVMGIAAKFMDAISVHYYTVPLEWKSKGSATDFGEDMYYLTLEKGLRMDELLRGHIAIMDRHDPERAVGLIVDEWGAWYDVEPGTNPGFLYQQNTMRDAVLAAVTLDIFNAFADRVVMANIAQTVNVLQSVILTEGAKTILTPTYHVFDLYKDHQDADALGFWLENDEVGAGGANTPRLSASVSTKGGAVAIAVTNLSACESVTIDCELRGLAETVRRNGGDAAGGGTAAGNACAFAGVTGKVVTGAINAHNDFDCPDNVIIKELEGVEADGARLRFTLPACSVASLSVKL